MKKILVLLILTLLANYSPAQITDTSYVQVSDVKIYTVLTKPDNASDYPLTVIIAGSGPTDLNGNQTNMKNNCLLYLSNALVEHNIATLRFDKRGIAKSAYEGFNEADLNIDIFANDVTALINYFKEKGYNKVFIIGHSEGSLIGLISAQKTPVSGFISLCGAGNSADVILRKQLKPKLPPAFYTRVESIIDSLKNGQTVKNTPPQLNALFRPSVQPYLISWFKYDPAKLIAGLTCPILIIQGNKDLQVDQDEASILNQAAKNSKLVIINQMNHILKTISGDMQENVASYTNPDLPVNKDLIKNIIEFIRK